LHYCNYITAVNVSLSSVKHSLGLPHCAVLIRRKVYANGDGWGGNRGWGCGSLSHHGGCNWRGFWRCWLNNTHGRGGQQILDGAGCVPLCGRPTLWKRAAAWADHFLLLGQTAERLHGKSFDASLCTLGNTVVCTHTAKQLSDLWLLCRISHVFAKQLAIDRRLTRQAEAIQQSRCDASLECSFSRGEQVPLPLVNDRCGGCASAAEQVKLLAYNWGLWGWATTSIKQATLNNWLELCIRQCLWSTALNLRQALRCLLRGH
jgi:hypothetical protein